jgi:hypothetical protein
MCELVRADRVKKKSLAGSNQEGQKVHYMESHSMQSDRSLQHTHVIIELVRTSVKDAFETSAIRGCLVKSSHERGQENMGCKYKVPRRVELPVK